MGGLLQLNSRDQSEMHRHHHRLLSASAILLFFLLPAPSAADVGTAAFYNPPYLPTACFGSDTTQFPAENMFAAAGEGIWDNNAACGRVYAVTCLSSATPGGCVSTQTIQVRIVDRASTVASPPSASGATMALSAAAYKAIASGSATSINIDFTRV